MRRRSRCRVNSWIVTSRQPRNFNLKKKKKKKKNKMMMMMMMTTTTMMMMMKYNTNMPHDYRQQQ